MWRRIRIVSLSLGFRKMQEPTVSVRRLPGDLWCLCLSHRPPVCLWLSCLSLSLLNICPASCLSLHVCCLVYLSEAYWVSFFLSVFFKLPPVSLFPYTVCPLALLSVSLVSCLSWSHHVCLSTFLSISLTPANTCGMSVFKSHCLSLCSPVCLLPDLSLNPLSNLPVCLSSVCLSFYLSICLPISLCLPSYLSVSSVSLSVSQSFDCCCF